MVSDLAVVETGISRVLLRPRRGALISGTLFFSLYLAEKENETGKYRRASHFVDKSQVVGISPSPF